MRYTAGVVLLVAAAALGAVGGYLVRGMLAPVAERPALDARGDLERDAAARVERARLRAENEELAARLAALERQATERAAADASPAPAVAKAGKASETPLKLASVDEADAIFADAIARTDLEAVLRLGAALLTMGEEGYEKFLALVSEFGNAMKEDEVLRAVCGDDRNAGLMARVCVENIEGVLKLGLYLQTREGGDAPDEARFLRNEFNDDLGRMLLGFYGGGDAEIDDGIMELSARELAAALEQENGLESPEVERAIKRLSMLKSERATEMLLELAEDAPPSVLQKILFGLVFQGTPRALSAFRTLTAGLHDAKGMEAIDSILRRRQGSAQE